MSRVRKIEDSGAKTTVLGSEGVKLDFSRSWASLEDTVVFVKFGSLLGRRWDSRVDEDQSEWKLLLPLLDTRARLKILRTNRPTLEQRRDTVKMRGKISPEFFCAPEDQFRERDLAVLVG
ncbi:hypothetical protein U1Q18_016029 [Sarracenia purpurea var. burkii]